MLAKKYRLPVQSVINRKGQTFRGRYVTLKMFTSTRPHGRVGVVVSKKTAGLATERNRLKRLAYGAVDVKTLSTRNVEFLLLVQRTASADPRAMIEEIQSFLNEAK